MVSSYLAVFMRRGLAFFWKFTFNRSAQEGETFPAVRKNHPIALSANIDLRGLIIMPACLQQIIQRTCNALAGLLQHVGIDKINVVCPQLHVQRISTPATRCVKR